MCKVLCHDTCEHVETAFEKEVFKEGWYDFSSGVPLS